MNKHLRGGARESSMSEGSTYHSRVAVRVKHAPALAARQEPQAHALLQQNAPVPVGGGNHQPLVAVYELIGVLPQRAEVDEVEAGGGVVVQEVRPIGVRLHEAPHEQLLQAQPQDLPREHVAGGLRQRDSVFQRRTPHELRRQHVRRRQVSHNVWHVEEGVVAHGALEHALAVGFAHVVALRSQLLAHLCHTVLRVPEAQA